MKMNINYIPSEANYKMERLDTGIIINLGGRSLPF